MVPQVKEKDSLIMSEESDDDWHLLIIKTTMKSADPNSLSCYASPAVPPKQISLDSESWNSQDSVSDNEDHQSFLRPASKRSYKSSQKKSV